MEGVVFARRRVDGDPDGRKGVRESTSASAVVRSVRNFAVPPVSPLTLAGQFAPFVSAHRAHAQGRPQLADFVNGGVPRCVNSLG